MAKKAAKRATQTEINLNGGPGVDPVRIPEIDAAIAEYEPLKEARMAASTLEVEAKQKLVDLIHAHKDQLNDGQGNMFYVMEDGTKLALEPQEEKLTITPPKKKKDKKVVDSSEKGLA